MLFPSFPFSLFSQAVSKIQCRFCYLAGARRLVILRVGSELPGLISKDGPVWADYCSLTLHYVLVSSWATPKCSEFWMFEFHVLYYHLTLFMTFCSYQSPLPHSQIHVPLYLLNSIYQDSASIVIYFFFKDRLFIALTGLKSHSVDQVDFELTSTCLCPPTVLRLKVWATTLGFSIELKMIEYFFVCVLSESAFHPGIL